MPTFFCISRTYRYIDFDLWTGLFRHSTATMLVQVLSQDLFDSNQIVHLSFCQRFCLNPIIGCMSFNFLRYTSPFAQTDYIVECEPLAENIHSIRWIDQIYRNTIFHMLRPGNPKCLKQRLTLVWQSLIIQKSTLHYSLSVSSLNLPIFVNIIWTESISQAQPIFKVQFLHGNKNN